MHIADIEHEIKTAIAAFDASVQLRTCLHLPAGSKLAKIRMALS
jgi:hypothetical protein